jgi:hypothetical protein
MAGWIDLIKKDPAIIRSIWSLELFFLMTEVAVERLEAERGNHI